MHSSIRYFIHGDLRSRVDAIAISVRTAMHQFARIFLPRKFKKQPHAQLKKCFHTHHL
jgi:hypothetical protein